MKLLMVYMEDFAYSPRTKNLETAEAASDRKQINDVLVGFIHAEQEDEPSAGNVETKLIKNLKWAARKNSTDRILLHSFAHLSDSKASPMFTKDLLDGAEKRLINAGYKTFQTPFGYFLDLDLKAPGTSLARIFKAF